MKERNKKRKIAKISVFITSIFLIVFSVTYAFITTTLTGTKKVTLTAGTLSLVLNEGNAITISDALPMYDQVGMIQENAFTFSLVNNTSVSTDYTLKLQKISTANELDTSIVKYYLTKDGVGEPVLLSTLTDGVIDTGTIVGSDTIEYTLRMWIDSSVTANEEISGKSLSYMLKIEASQGDETPSVPTTVTFAGITEDVNETVDAMFNYTSEGVGPIGGDSVAPTNGIYAMEDDDSLSYYYRGKVNNLVKFGSYTKDYYVYRYSDYDFISLEACQYMYSECSESDKVMKYAASDNVPMYWRIIRVNGDGTIRMIYAGTTPDAEGQELGIGTSRYNEEDEEQKYAGYTYDNQSTKTNSDAKTEIDNWYTNVLERTIYDSQIATGKFCSDSNGYEYDETATQLWGEDVYTYGCLRRNVAHIYGIGNSKPSFKCNGSMDANIGGSYNLKVGLITLDEVVSAGGSLLVNNNSYYLNNGDVGFGFWTMSPIAVFSNIYPDVGWVLNGGSITKGDVGRSYVSLRPVINLRADVTFKSGTDGSTTAPYELSVE